MSLYPSIMITFNICYSNFYPEGQEYEELQALLALDNSLVLAAAEAARAAGQDPDSERITYLDYLPALHRTAAACCRCSRRAF